jgi:hypothetical protein
MAWVFDNQGAIVVVTQPAGKFTAPVTLLLKDYNGTALTDPIFILGIQYGLKVNQYVQKTLGDKLYYQEFGSDIKPIVITGITVHVATDTDADDRYDAWTETGFTALSDFFNDNRGIGRGVYSNTFRQCKLTIGGHSDELDCLLVNMDISHNIQAGGVPVFQFTMTFLPLEDPW